MQHLQSAAASSSSRHFGTASGEKDRQFATTLARGLDVLRAFGPNSLRLGNKEIVARTGLPKATVSRLTYTLTQLGYLRRNAHQNKYELAPQALGMCQPLLAGLPMRHSASSRAGASRRRDGRAPPGSPICDRTAWWRSSRRTARSVPAALEIGAAMPMLSSAAGLAFIAGCPAGRAHCACSIACGCATRTGTAAQGSVDAALEDIGDTALRLARREP